MIKGYKAWCAWPGGLTLIAASLTPQQMRCKPTKNFSNIWEELVSRRRRASSHLRPGAVAECRWPYGISGAEGVMITHQPRGKVGWLPAESQTSLMISTFRPVTAFSDLASLASGNCLLPRKAPRTVLSPGTRYHAWIQVQFCLSP